jgi:hypothetical protein
MFLIAQSAFVDLRPRCVAVFAALFLAASVLGSAAVLRGMEYDEGYTQLLVAGHARPHWPGTVASAESLAHTMAGNSTIADIARDLREGDVHPPLYFWALEGWRQIAGDSLLAARLFSVLLGVAAIAVTGWIAVGTSIPPVAAMAFTIGCYGFAYTGHIARGFAMAQLLSLSAFALLLAASRHRRRGLGLAAGLLFGAATFANYLASFVAAAGLGWLLLRDRRIFVPAATGYLASVPPAIWFFLAQHDGRGGQFPPFALLPSLGRLFQYQAGSIFGALPLYLEGPVRVLLMGLLGAILVALTALVALRWSRYGANATNTLLALAAVAPAGGLLLLGALFNTTPIELRYLAFGVPFIGLLLAGATTSLPRSGVVLSGLLLGIQAVSLAGMLTRPETMQPQGRAAQEASLLAGSDGVIVVPFGHDGVGITAPFVAEARPEANILIVPRDALPGWVAERAAPFRHAVLAKLGLDEDSRAMLPTMERAFREERCWRQGGATLNLLVFDRAC